MQHKSWYDRHVLPYLIDVACGLSTITKQRQRVVPRAAGRVLWRGAEVATEREALSG